MKVFCLLFFIAISYPCFSQDFIYLKDKSIQKAKVLEVSVDKVKFKKFEILTGPTYEILKSDIIKIRYSNGYIDIIDKSYLPDSLENKSIKRRNDTVSYSMIYIVNTEDQGAKLKFPVYLNGRHVFTIRNHGRAIVKLFTEGQIILDRKPKDGSSPRLNLTIEHGEFIGVSIDQINSINMIQNKRFSLKMVNDSTDFKKFIQLEFNNPHSSDKTVQYFLENINDPIIQN
jgi:hypothetical protein